MDMISNVKDNDSFNDLSTREQEDDEEKCFNTSITMRTTERQLSHTSEGTSHDEKLTPSTKSGYGTVSMLMKDKKQDHTGDETMFRTPPRKDTEMNIDDIKDQATYKKDESPRCFIEYEYDQCDVNNSLQLHSPPNASRTTMHFGPELIILKDDCSNSERKLSTTSSPITPTLPVNKKDSSPPRRKHHRLRAKSVDNKFSNVNHFQNDPFSSSNIHTESNIRAPGTTQLSNTVNSAYGPSMNWGDSMSNEIQHHTQQLQNTILHEKCPLLSSNQSENSEHATHGSQRFKSFSNRKLTDIATKSHRIRTKTKSTPITALMDPMGCSYPPKSIQFMQKSKSLCFDPTTDSDFTSPFQADKVYSSLYHTFPPLPNRHHYSHSSEREEENAILQDIEGVKGEEQEKSYRDVLFALIYSIQMVILVYVGFRFGSEAISHGDSLFPKGGNTIDNDILSTATSATTTDTSASFIRWNESDTDNIQLQSFGNVEFTYRSMILLSCFSGSVGITVSVLAFIFMNIFANQFLQVALFTIISLAFTWGTFGILLSPKSFVPIVGIIFFGLSVGYAFVVWDHIPFASSNLKVALTAMRERGMPVVGMSCCFQIIALMLNAFYIITGIGMYDAFNSDQMRVVDQRWGFVCFLGLFLSYYWNVQILMRLLHVVIAGVVSDWWLNKRSNQSNVFQRSLMRATIHSFGSVCLGSFLIGIVEILNQISDYMRPKRDDSHLVYLQHSIFLVQEYFVSFVDYLSSKVNPWAFTYIGMYGYNFLEAGDKATELFQKRGWTRIVSDNLVSVAVLFLCLVIGGLTGLFAVVIESIEGSCTPLSSLNQASLIAFIIGICGGFVVSMVLFSTIISSINTILVCFAAYPIEFDENHPVLSNEIRQAWATVRPKYICKNAISLYENAY